MDSGGKMDYKGLIRKLEMFRPEERRALIGLDGFVDEVFHIVEKRYSEEQYDRMEYLADYGNRIAEAAGLSLNIEMVPIRKKLGGNGAIFANSLSGHGVAVTYIGSCGESGLHPVFSEMAERAGVISLGEPAYTDAIEFRDGKIISSKLENLKNITWERLLRTVGKENLVSMIEGADMVGFENWTMVMQMSDIWEHLLSDILPHVKFRKGQRPKLFIDLADPSKRPEEDIVQAIHILERFEMYFEVILGLNRREANLIAGLLAGGKQDLDVAKTAERLKKELHISKVAVHAARIACAVDNRECVCAESPYCKEPKQTTGAGDSFNAGYMLGELSGVSLGESLILGTANAAYYVRNARNADYRELQDYLRALDDERGDAHV